MAHHHPRIWEKIEAIKHDIRHKLEHLNSHHATLEFGKEVAIATTRKYQ